MHSDTFSTRILPLMAALEGVALIIDEEFLTERGRRPLVVTPSFFRKFGCPTTCNVCCLKLPRLTLDWLLEESNYLEGYSLLKQFSPNRRKVVYQTSGPDGLRTHEANVMTLFKGDDTTRACRYLGKVPGREGVGCTLWPNAPVECLSAYSMMFSIRDDRILLSSRGVGRAWAYDPEPECSFETEMDLEDLGQKFNLLARYQEIAELLDFKTAVHRLTLLLSRVQQAARECSSGLPRDNIVIP